ncbi:hypothetical protein N430_02379 [Pseudomonas sp. CC120222-01a]|nr:hypothetical protein N430_02379 [Pseudomonas sp. CC120222-01a]
MDNIHALTRMEDKAKLLCASHNLSVTAKALLNDAEFSKIKNEAPALPTL